MQQFIHCHNFMNTPIEYFPICFTQGIAAAHYHLDSFVEYVGRLPTPTSRTTKAHYISYKQVGRVVLRHDDRRPYSTQLAGTYKAYLVFYKQVNLLANLNTCSLPDNLNLVTWHKTRVISRVKASPSTPTPANRSRARARKPKAPAKRATSTKQDKTSPISVPPSSVATDARRPVTRSTSQQRSDTASATTSDATPLGTDTAGDTASAAPSSSQDAVPTPDPAVDAAKTRTSTRPPLITPVSQTYPLNYDTEAYLDTSEEEDNGSKGKSVNLCYYHSFSSFLSFLCCMLATYRP